ncbi:uncharacterized protein TNCV_1237122 [Trichonephila clavipes]|nr:uncharacterized protein TNCV_1237122 [Trichonephila clavipes]
MTPVCLERISEISHFNASFRDCGSPVVRVSDHGRYVMSSSPVPQKIRRVGQRCTLNLSRAETSSRWCGVVYGIKKKEEEEEEEPLPESSSLNRKKKTPAEIEAEDLDDFTRK